MFLFDEPLSNLDAALRAQMRVELADLHAKLGATMIYVTHDQVEAMTMASRIVVLNRGRIEQVGAPLALYNNPANLFVAGFLGAPRMNFVAGKVVEVAGHGARIASAGGLTVAFEGLSGPLAIGDTVTIGIRPEKLRIGDAAADVRFCAEVRLTEYLGRETIVYADAGDLTTTGSDSGTGVFTIQIGEIKPFHAGTPIRSASTPAMPTSSTPTGGRSPPRNLSQGPEQGHQLMKRTPPTPLSVWRTLDLDDFLLGVPHYPEHVDESYWERDAERMAAAGFNVVRMGEFAWHIFEPREGVFDFSLFDRAIDVLAAEGIRTIFCTPTATPPRWLTAAYPEVLRVDENGRVADHGSRQHADTNSPVYRMHSRRITEALADHYRDNPHVIGWQTDNELNTTVSTSYSEATAGEFRRYLQNRYETIAALNFAWGGHFWATAYDHFDQITLPRDRNPGFPSPGHFQDYHRFLAHATAAFQHDQVEILRRINPDWFIFHNLGRLEDIDFRGQFGQDLDFLGFDIYPMLYDEMRRTGGHPRRKRCISTYAAPIAAISSFRNRPPASAASRASRP